MGEQRSPPSEMERQGSALVWGLPGKAGQEVIETAVGDADDAASMPSKCLF